MSCVPLSLSVNGRCGWCEQKSSKLNPKILSEDGWIVRLPHACSSLSTFNILFGS